MQEMCNSPMKQIHIGNQICFLDQDTSNWSSVVSSSLRSMIDDIVDSHQGLAVRLSTMERRMEVLCLQRVQQQYHEDVEQLWGTIDIQEQ